jgi:hypothetical protein
MEVQINRNDPLHDPKTVASPLRIKVLWRRHIVLSFLPGFLSKRTAIVNRPKNQNPCASTNAQINLLRM